MLEFEPIHWMTFLAISSLILLTYLLLQWRTDRLTVRLRRLAGKEEAPTNTKTVGQLAFSVLPKMGEAFIPSNEEQRTQLQTRLIHAGYYGRQALVVFMGVKMLLTLVLR